MTCCWQKAILASAQHVAVFCRASGLYIAYKFSAFSSYFGLQSFFFYELMVNLQLYVPLTKIID